MGLLSSVSRTYAGKWSRTNVETFNADELKEISSASVVASDYGMSVCLTLVSGGMKFIPVSRDQVCTVGEKIEPKNIKVVTLSREGDNDCYKAEW